MPPCSRRRGTRRVGRGSLVLRIARVEPRLIAPVVTADTLIEARQAVADREGPEGDERQPPVVKHYADLSGLVMFNPYNTPTHCLKQGLAHGVVFLRLSVVRSVKFDTDLSLKVCEV